MCRAIGLVTRKIDDRLGRVGEQAVFGIARYSNDGEPITPVRHLFADSVFTRPIAIDKGLVDDGNELRFRRIRSGEFTLASATGFVYDVSKDKKPPAMRAYVSEFYERKQSEQDKVKRFFYKLLLNALSGKFIQTRRKADKDTIDEDDNYTGDTKLVAGGLFHPFIAALITGHTRARIHQLEHQYRAIHTATDGIVTKKRITKKDLTEGLGGVTCEARGDVLILRNKLYIFYTNDGEMPSTVFKGKKMAGHLGDVRVTTQNLRIVSTDVERGLIMVRGAVPGSDGGYVLIKDAVKRKAPKDLPFPAAIRQSAQAAAPAAEAPTSEAGAE